MNHKAELTLHRFLDKATDGEKVLSNANINKIAKDIKEALHRQFGSNNSRKKFGLRMSNLGRPTCQLWFEKNEPETALPFPTTFVMNMLLGDIVEAAFKGILKEAGVKYEDKDNYVELELEDTTIKGSYDLVINDAVDDVKSASDWSYRNKFESYETLNASDPFGYVGQRAGYAKASGKKAGGWWVVNKANGNIKYVAANGLDIDSEVTKLNDTVATVNDNVFERCFNPVPETFRGKATGNTVLNSNCKFCDYRHECFPTLEELPSKVSQAKNKPIIQYVM